MLRSSLLAGSARPIGSRAQGWIRPYSSPPEDPDQRRAVGREPSVERGKGARGSASHPRANTRARRVRIRGARGSRGQFGPRRAAASLPLSRGAAPRLYFFVTYGSSWLLSLWFSYWPRPSSCRPWCPLSPRGGPFSRAGFSPPRWIFYTDRPPAATLA